MMGSIGFARFRSALLTFLVAGVLAVGALGVWPFLIPIMVRSMRTKAKQALDVFLANVNALS